MFGLGIGELILVMFVILLLFGSKKLPELGSALGKSIKSFKSGLNNNDEQMKKSEKLEK
jgi:sec-independent protein translocase protein TatA